MTDVRIMEKDNSSVVTWYNSILKTPLCIVKQMAENEIFLTFAEK